MKLNSDIVSKHEIYSALRYTPEPKHYINNEGVCMYPSRSGRTTRAVINALYVGQFTKVYFCVQKRSETTMRLDSIQSMLKKINSNLVGKTLITEVEVSDYPLIKLRRDYSDCVVIFDHSVTKS